MASPTYEVLALRYARVEERVQAECLLFPDDHMAPMPIDFFVFAIRGNGRTIVVDTGFDKESADRRGRKLMRSPELMLADAGIDAGNVADVVLTHMHWDHAGGMKFFPKAKFHLQDKEMAYCTSRCMCEPILRRPFDGEHVVDAVRAIFADRVVFHDGSGDEIAPGVTLHWIGGHSKGIMCVRVPTARGSVVLAGDTTHYWANIRGRNPFPIVVNVEEMLAGYTTLESLADGPDHIIPGHDPLILKKFAPLNGNPEIVRLDLPPIG
jgi:glyoxylase-like metal-dependent hydrolase (beta-lactamase superfamily II)